VNQSTGTANSAAVPWSERRVVYLLAFIVFANVLDFMMVMPLGPDFAKALDINPNLLGIIGASYMLAGGIAGVAGASFLDRFDRRTALAICVAGLSFGTVAAAFATDFTTLVICRVVAGLFGGPATALTNAIIADVVPFERRGKAMGTIMLGFSMASIFGVPLGLRLAREGTWHTPFVVVAAVLALAAIAARVLLPSMKEHMKTVRLHARIGGRLARPAIRFAAPTGLLRFVAPFNFVPELSHILPRNRRCSRSEVSRGSSRCCWCCRESCPIA